MLCLHDPIHDAAPAVQRFLSAVDAAHALTAFILAAWQVARVRTSHRVEAVLAARSQHPTRWPRGPQCGAGWRRKGLAKRQSPRRFGPIQWRRRVGRGPHGCATPQGAPWDEALGLPPPQRSRGEFQARGCAVAVCGPCATAARVRGWDRGSLVRPQAVWGWGQAAGQQALEPRQKHVPALAHGDRPAPEALAAEVAAAPVG
jgi:hypothetical protein